MESAGNSNNLESVGPECEKANITRTKGWEPSHDLFFQHTFKKPSNQRNFLKMWRTETYQCICLSLWYTPGSGMMSHRPLNQLFLTLCQVISSRQRIWSCAANYAGHMETGDSAGHSITRAILIVTDWRKFMPNLKRGKGLDNGSVGRILTLQTQGLEFLLLNPCFFSNDVCSGAYL